MTQMPQTSPDGIWTLGWRLQWALKHGHVPAARMAQTLGVDTGTVSRWMNDKGKTPPKRGFLLQWAVGCGVNPDWLIEGTGSPLASHSPDGGGSAAIRCIEPHAEVSLISVLHRAA